MTLEPMKELDIKLARMIDKEAAIAAALHGAGNSRYAVEQEARVAALEEVRRIAKGVADRFLPDRVQ